LLSPLIAAFLFSMQRIDTAPYKPRDFDKGEIPAVLVVSWGKGDPQKDAIYTVFMDEAGHVREHTKFDNLMDPEARADFSELVRRRKPDVIAAGGFSVLTVKLWERVREVIGYGEHQDSLGREEPNASSSAEGGAEVPAIDAKDLVPVIWVSDQVARIFQHSRRAAEEFGSLPTIGRYCAALARYIQSPLNEYAALGPDITAISFHEDQQLVRPQTCLQCHRVFTYCSNQLPSDKLLTALERSLVSIVNDVGVDVNRAVTEPYYRHLLPFVAGLGPRKAQAVLKKIGQLVRMSR
jgi:transcription elongation factor SPT6